MFELNALIVTLAVGAITSGVTLWYRESLPQEARVPPGMAAWGDARFLGSEFSVWVVAALAIILNVVLRKTAIGRHFSAVGANPRAAWVAGINVAVYQTAAFTVAAFLYGIAGILVSAFIRNPTLKVGEPYLLAPIAAAVLGGTAMSGGIGSMVAVAGAALFLTQLGQVLQMLGLVLRTSIRHRRHCDCARHGFFANQFRAMERCENSVRRDRPDASEPLAVR